MPQNVIQIPTLNDGPNDFTRLFRIWNQANSNHEDVLFNFSSCQFLRPNAVAFLGGLARLIQSQRRMASFDWDSVNDSWVRTTIRQNGFASIFGDPSEPWSGTSIPYREDSSLNMNGIMDYLTYDWLGKGWGKAHLSERVRDAIAGTMWEVYNNAFEHSKSVIGVFSCGQHFKKKNELCLSTIDFGLGIPAKVRNFVGTDPRAQSLRSDLCLRWAFTRGKSTCTGGVARGLGLDLLKEFVYLNQGKLEIYSNDGYVIIDKHGDRYQNCSHSFEGTVVHVTLHCDEKLYRFRNEAC